MAPASERNQLRRISQSGKYGEYDENDVDTCSPPTKPSLFHRDNSKAEGKVGKLGSKNIENNEEVDQASDLSSKHEPDEDSSQFSEQEAGLELKQLPQIYANLENSSSVVQNHNDATIKTGAADHSKVRDSTRIALHLKENELVAKKLAGKYPVKGSKGMQFQTKDAGLAPKKIVAVELENLMLSARIEDTYVARSDIISRRASAPGAQWVNGINVGYDTATDMCMNAVCSSIHNVYIDVENNPPIVSATPVDDIEINEAEAVPESRIKWRQRVMYLNIILLVVVIGVALSFGLSSSSLEKSQLLTQDLDYPPTLQVVQDEGFLRCGVSNRTGFSYFDEIAGRHEGFEVDLCRAVAAAIFGSGDRLELVISTTKEKFPLLHNREVHLQARTTTHTMERDVFEEMTESPYSFTIPYLYESMRFGGDRKSVACAESFADVGSWSAINEDCAGTKICVNHATTDFDNVKEFIPQKDIVIVEGDDLGLALRDKRCNVISGELVKISKYVVSQMHDGEYIIGERELSKEPLAMLMRGDDVTWSEFVNAVFLSLVAAEAKGITQATAKEFGQTDLFKDFPNMFIDAISTVGNYGEMYERNLESIVPREGSTNFINTNGQTGLIYSHPFGAIETVGPKPTIDSTLQSIATRGELYCGLLEDDESKKLSRKFCYSILGALPNVDKVVFIDFENDEQGFEGLGNMTIDVLTGANFNLKRDILGRFSFSQPFFYGEGDEVRAISTREDDRQWSSFCYWVVTATFYAEEKGIQQSTSNAMPKVNLFGEEYIRMLKDVVLATGNYGEMYASTIEPVSPRTGRNLLNIEAGPQFFVPTGF